MFKLEPLLADLESTQVRIGYRFSGTASDFWWSLAVLGEKEWTRQTTD